MTFVYETIPPLKVIFSFSSTKPNFEHKIKLLILLFGQKYDFWNFKNVKMKNEVENLNGTKKHLFEHNLNHVLLFHF